MLNATMSEPGTMLQPPMAHPVPSPATGIATPGSAAFCSVTRCAAELLGHVANTANRANGRGFMMRKGLECDMVICGVVVPVQ